MKRPKDILSQPYHIQEYINYLERKNSSLHNVRGIMDFAKREKRMAEGSSEECDQECDNE